MSKTKRILEWILIGLFIATVASITSILIYRSVVNSDWYTERQARKSLDQTIEKVNNTENIEYIKIDDNAGERFIYDVPSELFDDISIISFDADMGTEEWRKIWRNPMVTVFFEDDTYESFFITDDGKVYCGSFELQCPSLVNWYN